ncbi:MAG: monovalent cation/H+ antiporter subunit D [Pseudomonadota bacterium]
MTASFADLAGLPWAAHWPVVPVLLPLLFGTLLVLLSRASLAVQRTVGGLAMLVHLGVASALVALAEAGPPLAYAVGDWAAPFGIFLVIDRLSAWMLLVTALVALPAWAYACAGEDRGGPWFHALFQFQLLGIHGAFATGDLFNLFVFFEILLIASYALLLHGANAARARAAVHVVVLNLVGSALFLLAVGCIYAAVGTLNLADLAVKAPAITPEDAGLLQTGAFLLLIVFALKAAALPLGFWLPPAYAAAPAACAALFAVLTKVGVYSILRVYTLVFPSFEPGPEGPTGLVLPLGLATLALGAIGALAADRLRPLAGHLVLVSIGTLLVAVGTFREAGYAAAVYYVAHSTFAGAALFLVADLVARQRRTLGDRLDAGEPVRQPALLAALFAGGTIAIVGLPPLSGFVGKLAVLQATSPDAERVWVLLLVGTLLTVVVVARAASALFWRTGDRPTEGKPASRLASAAAAGCVALLVALTLAAGPAFDYANATARQLLDRSAYVEAVFTVPSLSAPVGGAPHLAEAAAVAERGFAPTEPPAPAAASSTASPAAEGER